MPVGKNKAEYNAYMRVYIKERYHRRRKAAIRKLGGKCVRCGSKKQLEFDHKARTSKIADIARIWSYSDRRFWEEVAKCQLLCRPCHQDKSIVDLGFTKAKGTHGTISSYRYCRCDLCKKAHNGYVNEWKRKRKLGS
jgi:hypothetical protein